MPLIQLPPIRFPFYKSPPPISLFLSPLSLHLPLCVFVSFQIPFPSLSYSSILYAAEGHYSTFHPQRTIQDQKYTTCFFPLSPPSLDRTLPPFFVFALPFVLYCFSPLALFVLLTHRFTFFSAGAHSLREPSHDRS